jgi:hypothetical protein
MVLPITTIRTVTNAIASPFCEDNSVAVAKAAAIKGQPKERADLSIDAAADEKCMRSLHVYSTRERRVPAPSGNAVAHGVLTRCRQTRDRERIRSNDRGGHYDVVLIHIARVARRHEWEAVGRDLRASEIDVISWTRWVPAEVDLSRDAGSQVSAALLAWRGASESESFHGHVANRNISSTAGVIRPAGEEYAGPSLDDRADHENNCCTAQTARHLRKVRMRRRSCAISYCQMHATRWIHLFTCNREAAGYPHRACV